MKNNEIKTTNCTVECRYNQTTVSQSQVLGAGVNFWEFCRSAKGWNNTLISCGRKKMMKTRWGLC